MEPRRRYPEGWGHVDGRQDLSMTHASRAFTERVESLTYLGLLGMWCVTAAIFACVYMALDTIPGQGVIEPLQTGPAVLQWYDALYFSVATGTTLGYGDIIPIGASRFFAGLQSIISFMILALTVSKLASIRSERMLAEVHALSREVKELISKEK